MNKTIVRGLIRVVLPELTQQVLRFATAKGCVNFGCITVDEPLISNCRREKILVIGAGPAGLSAASQLSNFGFDVEVFEGEIVIGLNNEQNSKTQRVHYFAHII